MMNEQPSQNHCGECQACCVVYCLPELQKPAYTPCRHLGAAGCSIHDHLPATCSGFLCGYLLYPWAAELRPDRCGVVFVRESNVRAMKTSRGATVQLSLAELGNDSPKLWTGNCVTADVFRNPPEAVRKFIYRENRKGGIVVLTYDGGGRIELEVIAPQGVFFTANVYLDFCRREHGKQLDAVQAFMRTPSVRGA
jgi:hypothetical protein